MGALRRRNVMLLALMWGFWCAVALLPMTSEAVARWRPDRQDVPVADSFDFPLPANVVGWRAGYNRQNSALIRSSGCYPGKKIYDLWHAGEDWKAASGTEVRAIANGLVVYADPNFSYPGNVVVIEHRLPEGGTIYSMYGHLTPKSLKVDTEARRLVGKGDVIGTVTYQEYTDSAGVKHDNSHLHWEIRTFFDGGFLCSDKESKSSGIPGPGYTYPERPDVMGYRDPSAFVTLRLTVGTPAPQPAPPAPPQAPQPDELGAKLLKLPAIPVVRPGETAQIRVVLQNTGSHDWPANGIYRLARIDGAELGLRSPQQTLATVARGASGAWELTLTAPPEPGVYESLWRMTADGAPFGEKVAIALVVTPQGSSAGFIETLQAMIEKARQDVSRQFTEAWEELKAQLMQRIREEIEREIQRRLAPICGAAPAGLAGATCIVWWRRRRITQ
jgi:murein DD-endopeptidase MepM/ murein hydrolase activator NlpD